MTELRDGAIVGELVDADHDGLPDTTHAHQLETRPDTGVETAILDAELIDEVTEPVDAPVRSRDGMAAVLEARTAKRRPVVATWIQDGEELKAVARWAVGHALHISAFHTVRSPIYGAKLAVRAPVGAGRLLAGASRWMFDQEAAPLRSQAVQRGDADQYFKLEHLRNTHMKQRLIVAGVVMLVVVVAVVLVDVLAPVWATWLAGAATVGALGWGGRPRHQPFISPAVIPTAYQRLTSEIVVRALSSLGISEINKAVAKRGADGITFPAPIQKDGPGWRAEIDLPYGVTVSDILERRESLASGLRRPLGCVWPEGDVDQHAGRLVLWVGNTDLRKTRQPPWPLAKQGQADLFKSIPFGTDQRGRPVGIDLMFANLLLGAMPRQGKTASMRLVLLACALDPTAQLRIFELKGTGDLSPLEPVCHHYASGATYEACEAALESLRELYAELTVRAQKISELAKRSRALVPDNKVTPDASARLPWGLFPLVMGIDECQELFTHEDFGKEAAKLCTAIIKRGPALGVILLLATQRPDKESLPKAISANVSIRFCLKVDGQVENDMVLGTSKYQQGIRATVFTPQLDAGIGYLVGAGPTHQVVRTYYINGPKAEGIVERARVLREGAGTLTGHAIGEAPEAGPKVSLVEDIAMVMATAERMWSEQIVAGLAELRPEFYEDWTPAQLAAALPDDLKTTQVWQKDLAMEDGGSPNRQGLKREAVLAALEPKRELERGHL